MSWRKGSNASVETSGGSNGSRGAGTSSKGAYPFALTLRIRVVQIVCGIAAVVMGSVAAIEERHNFNLSLGVPAGAITVLAAAWSVHRSLHRNAGGRRIGPWITRILWAIACTLHMALLVLAVRTAFRRHKHGDSHISNTSLSLAVVQGILAAAILIAAGFAARLRWIYGATPDGPPPRHDRGPRSTSHTAVSMVPLASTYGCNSITNDNNMSKSNISLSSENEVMEITVTDNKATFAEKQSSPRSRSSKNDTTNKNLHIMEKSSLKLLDNDYSQTTEQAVHGTKLESPHFLSGKIEQKNSVEKFEPSCDYIENSDTEHLNQSNKYIM